VNSFRKQLPPKPVPTVREMVTKYGDEWYLFCASHPISRAVWSGDKKRGDYYDAGIMIRCEEGKRDRIDPVDVLLAEDEGRPISFEWHSTPQLWSAIFKDEYDGAPDSRSPMGFGKTKAEAIADLLDKDAGE
jgi:hypothetical protein